MLLGAGLWADSAPELWSPAPLPRGALKLARFAGFDALPPAWRVLEDLSRRLHAPYGELAGRPVPPLAPDDTRPSEVLVRVPLPAATWSKVLGRPLTADLLVAELLENHRAGQLFRGLSTLDDGLLTAFAEEPEALRRIYRDAPEAWAVFARALETSHDGLLVPGGAEALPLWEQAVGERVRRPARFAAALMLADGGRLAWLYDIAARLDPARQHYLLGLEQPDLELRWRHLRRLRTILAAEPDWWHALRPMSRPWPDAESVLRQAQLDASGFLRVPPGLPRRALGNGEDDGAVSAASLLEWALAGDPAQRSRRLLRLAFVQRAWGERPPGSLAAVEPALAALDRRPLLVLTLESVGVVAPPAVEAAAAKAGRIDELPQPLGVPAALAYQGALALLAQARRSDGLPAAAAEAAALRLIALPPDPCALGPWLAQLAGPSPAGAERALVERLAGPAHAAGEVEWDEQRYRLDPPAAERERLQRWRQLQRGATLDQALQGCRSAAVGPPRAAAGRQLAEVLRGFAYARSLGWPDLRAQAGAALPARHDLEWGELTPERGPWSLPSEEQLPGRPRRVRGGLLGLELALATRQLRRLDADLLERPPTLQQDFHLPLAWRAAGLQRADLAVGAARAAAQALRRGRERLRAAGLDPARLDALAVAARLPAWRRRALRHLAASVPDDLPQAFLPSELARLGGLTERGWAWSALPAEALLGPHLPLGATPEDALAYAPGAVLPAAWTDLELRLLELLHDAGLGEALAPALQGSLIQEFVDTAQPVGLDDAESWQRYAAALGPRQLADHVSALVTLGFLQPLFSPDPAP